MKKSLLTFSAVIATATIANAKTVLWYHFNEGAPGTATTGESKILNAVDNEKLSGTPCTMSLGGFTWNNTPTIGTVAGFMPTYTNTFNGVSSWFDPVTGVHSTDRTALNLVRQYRNTTGGQNGCGYRSMVVVDDPDDELKLPTFTVEFFIRFNPENPNPPAGSSIVDGEAQSHIISMRGGSGEISTQPWMIGSEASGEMMFYMGWNGTRYYATAYPKGRDQGWSNPNWKMHALKDGRWHHVAITVDGSDETAVTMKTYVDYYQEQTITMDAPITYTPGAALTIGGTTNNQTCACNAAIDELRISDTVLTANQFLHPYNIQCDEDTAIYLSFDDWFANIDDRMYGNSGEYYRKFAATYLNEAGNTNGLYCPFILHNSFGDPKFTNDTVSATHWNIAASTVSDTNAYHFVINEAGGQDVANAISLPNPCQLAHNGGLTVEGFFKMPGPSSDVATTYLLNAYNGGTTWRISLNKNSYLLSVLNDWSGIDLSTKVLADNDWHHIAVVSDETKNEVRLYVDHVIAGTKTGFTLSHTPFASGKTISTIRLGDLQNTGGIGCYNGFIDELRWTLRPLEPQEFLTARTRNSAVIASASFENNLNEGPVEYTDLFANGLLDGSGSYAYTRPFKTDANTKSIYLNGATVSLGRNMLLEQDRNFTVEFFIRPENLKGEANLVSLMKPAPSAEAIWSVSLAADKSTLSVSAGSEKLNFTLPKAADDWWHHYALVFTKSEGLPTVALYADHVQIGNAQSLSSALDFASLSRGIVIGSANFTGWFDELRISEGALSTEEMMSVAQRLGFLLMIK